MVRQKGTEKKAAEEGNGIGIRSLFFFTADFCSIRVHKSARSFVRTRVICRKKVEEFTPLARSDLVPSHVQRVQVGPLPLLCSMTGSNKVLEGKAPRCALRQHKEANHRNTLFQQPRKTSEDTGRRGTTKQNKTKRHVFKKFLLSTLRCKTLTHCGTVKSSLYPSYSPLRDTRQKQHKHTSKIKIGKPALSFITSRITMVMYHTLHFDVHRKHYFNIHSSCRGRYC